MSKTRGLHIAGNWKMNLGRKETHEFFAELSKSWPEQKADTPSVRTTLYTPFLSLSEAQVAVSKAGLGVEIGAQNAHWEKSGAFTGEVSGPMLREIGIDSGLVGHS